MQGTVRARMYGRPQGGLSASDRGRSAKAPATLEPIAAPTFFSDQGRAPDATRETFAMAENKLGTQQNPQGIPQEGHGGSNQRGAQHQQGKDGNGAQKRNQKKKS
jgi:hypothetical protein